MTGRHPEETSQASVHGECPKARRPAHHDPAGSSLLAVVKPQSSLGRKRWSERQDSNLRPSAPKADALPGCATLRSGGAYRHGQTRAAITRGADAQQSQSALLKKGWRTPSPGSAPISSVRPALTSSTPLAAP